MKNEKKINGNKKNQGEDEREQPEEELKEI